MSPPCIDTDDEDSFADSRHSADATMFFGIMLSAAWGGAIALYRLYLAVFQKPKGVAWRDHAPHVAIVTAALLACVFVTRYMYACLVTKPSKRAHAAQLAKKTKKT
jgi:hypothetical protein